MRRTRKRLRPYRHGDLRRAVVAGALQEIETHGPAAMSLREIARRAGVSHAAPAHHFRDKAGVLTAVATDGYRILAAMTQETLDETSSLPEVGLTYVRFALSHRAHFEVMFRPDLYRGDDPELVAARDAGADVVFRAVRQALKDEQDQYVWGGVVAAWSFVHGFATLWMNRNFYPELGDDPERVARLAVTTVTRLVADGAFGPAHGETTRDGGTLLDRLANLPSGTAAGRRKTDKRGAPAGSRVSPAPAAARKKRRR